MKKIGILLIPMMILLVGIVMAADTITIGTETYIKDVEELTAVVNIDSVGSNCTSINVTISDGTTVTHIGLNTSAAAMYNNSDGDENLSTSWSTLNLSDDTQYTITMIAINVTNGFILATDTQTATPDNTLPTCSFDGSLASSTTYIPKQQWAIVGTNASSATIQFGSNAVNTMTETSVGDNFTYTDSVGITEGIYATVTGITSDGYNTTTCTSLTFVEIDDDATVTQLALILATNNVADETNNNTTLFLGLGALAVILYMRRKK